MIEQLIRHSQGLANLTDTGFGQKTTKLLIDLKAEDGRLINANLIVYPEKGKTFPVCPILEPSHCKIGNRHFLCDNVQYVTGYREVVKNLDDMKMIQAKELKSQQEKQAKELEGLSKKEADRVIKRHTRQNKDLCEKNRKHLLYAQADNAEIEKNRDDDEQAKIVEKHERFIAMLERAKKDYPDVGVVLEFLGNKKLCAQINDKVGDEGVKATDNATFSINGKPLLESTAWHNWWKTEYRRIVDASNEDKDTSAMISFASGKLVTPAMTHAMIKKVFGKSAALVCTNQESSCSYGLEQARNCAMSEEEVNQYTKALTDLVATSCIRLPGEYIVYWYSNSISKDDDPFAMWTVNEDEEMVEARKKIRKLFTDIKQGNRPDISLDTNYYILSCSINMSRIAVNEFSVGTFGELLNNVNKWFDDTSSDNLKIAKTFKLQYWLMQLYCRKGEKGSSIPKFASTEIWNCVVRGMHIPIEWVIKTLDNICHDIYDKDSREMREFDAAILLAYWKRFSERSGTMEIEQALTESTAHKCGRFMAMCESIQKKAFEPKSVNATITTKFFSSFSTQPKMSFAPLCNSVVCYFESMSKDPKKAGWANVLKCKVEDTLKDLKDLPTRFSVHERTQFSLGYWAENAERRANGKKKAEEAKTEIVMQVPVESAQVKA
jgi:CRISPR-associated protein Cas8c/Csd1 subtype I-C